MLGVLRGRAGDLVEGESLLRESVDLCVQANAPYGQGLALLELGRLYLRMAPSNVSDELEWHERTLRTLEEAAEQFERLGAAYDLDLTRSAIGQLQGVRANGEVAVLQSMTQQVGTWE